MTVPPIDRIPVESTSLAAVGYDAQHELLAVEFRSGAVYIYERVATAMHAALADAESKGTFFNANIRDRFRFHRARPPW